MSLKDLQTVLSEVTLKIGDKIIFSYDEIILELAKFFSKVKAGGNMIYFIGNGGSAGISIHMTSDFLKNGGMRTHSMHDPSVMTCLANDFGYEYVFSKQLEIIAQPNDLLVAISSSGESPNILQAIGGGRRKHCKILTFSGFKPDNSLRKLGDLNVYVPSTSYGIVESIHNMILQDVVDALK